MNNWPKIPYRAWCALTGKAPLTDLPKPVATQKYPQKARDTAKALAAFVKATQGRELGPDWARN